MKRLPIGVSTFEKLLSENYLYVDKTEIIYDLITKGRFYFLSRPRRFGKSLFISTLKEIYAGNKELFKDLWIGESDYDWEKFPVIYLDFSNLDIDSGDELKVSLSIELEELAEEFGIDVGKYPTPGLKLKKLIRTLAKEKSVVMLIDEYDFPLINNLDNEKICEANRKVLKNFFSVLKSLDSSLKAIYITGVTKFSKTSLFSGLNNLNDITMDPRASRLLGYTHEEIDTYFSPYVSRFAKNTERSPQTIIDEMESWYNGYRFSEDSVKVFNPFSVLYYLEKERRANYWLESGTPGFLIELLQHDFFVLEDLDAVKFSEKSLGTFDIGHIPLIPLLFQTGYLTIENYFPKTSEYRLGFPNAEVSESMKKYLLVVYSRTDIPTVERLASLLSNALIENNLPQFFKHLQTLFANIPYQLHVSKESYYHSLLQLVGSLLNLDIESEIPTDKGRIDLVLKTRTHIYLFELKLDASASVAIEQIERQKYYEKYRNSSKNIVLVGLSFNGSKNKLTLDYAMKELDK